MSRLAALSCCSSLGSTSACGAISATTTKGPRSEAISPRSWDCAIGGGDDSVAAGRSIRRSVGARLGRAFLLRLAVVGECAGVRGPVGTHDRARDRCGDRRLQLGLCGAAEALSIPGRRPNSARVHGSGERAGRRAQLLAAGYRGIQPPLAHGRERGSVHCLRFADHWRWRSRTGGCCAAEPRGAPRRRREAGARTLVHGGRGPQGRSGQQGASEPRRLAGSLWRIAGGAGPHDSPAFGRARDHRRHSRRLRLSRPRHRVGDDGELVCAGSGAVPHQAARPAMVCDGGPIGA